MESTEELPLCVHRRLLEGDVPHAGRLEDESALAGTASLSGMKKQGDKPRLSPPALPRTESGISFTQLWRLCHETTISQPPSGVKRLVQRVPAGEQTPAPPYPLQTPGTGTG